MPGRKWLWLVSWLAAALATVLAVVALAQLVRSAPRDRSDAARPAPTPVSTRSTGAVFAPPAESTGALPAATVSWRPPSLSLESIFSTPPDLSRVPPEEIRVLTVTGDIIPARSVNATAAQRGDFLYPYRATADFLRKGDLLFINLEAPLLARCPITREGMTFCGDARNVEGLVYAGTSVAALANNHFTNYGMAGAQETIDLLTRRGIAPAGLGHIALKEVRGLTFAFLAFNGIGAPVDRAALVRQIQEARPRADVVVVQFHWGKEYVHIPQSAPGIAPDHPRELARFAIDAGADLIIGNHPHWVQGVELYRDGFVAYAHGNFIFDQMWSRETREGVIGRYAFLGRQLVAVEYHPVMIENYAQPRLLEGEAAKRVLAQMEASSRAMAATAP